MEFNTYKSFLNSRQNGSTSAALHEKSESIIEHFRPVEQIVSGFSPVIYLLDYSTKKYIYVGETCFNLTGFTASYFVETGLEEYLSNWHEADFEVINKKVFPDNLAFLKTLHPEQYSDYIITYNYRFRNARSEYITLLQRCSFIAETKSSEPAGMVGVVFDINHYKTDLSIIHTIERVVRTHDGVFNELVFKKIHPVYDDPGNGIQTLSRREIEILKLMSGGLSSKQIADRLRLSINTINNHRRNMLVKTTCKSSAELTNYATKHGLL
jgi:DNA-binding CsgD family transcriptional regulator